MVGEYLPKKKKWRKKNWKLIAQVTVSGCLANRADTVPVVSGLLLTLSSLGLEVIPEGSYGFGISEWSLDSWRTQWRFMGICHSFLAIGTGCKKEEMAHC